LTLSTTIVEKIVTGFVDMERDSKLPATAIHDTDFCVRSVFGFSAIGSGGLVASDASLFTFIPRSRSCFGNRNLASGGRGHRSVDPVNRCIPSSAPIRAVQENTSADIFATEPSNVSSFKCKSTEFSETGFHDDTVSGIFRNRDVSVRSSDAVTRTLAYVIRQTRIFVDVCINVKRHTSIYKDKA
jgi:hypothetical protein